jgi:uncharacterized protein YrzB (UPF0473 family)
MSDEDWEKSIVVITDDEGKDTEFFILDEAEYKGGRYLLLIETEFLEDDEAEAVILKEVGEDEKDMVYEEPGDEDFDAIAKLFDSRLDDYDVEI